MTTRCTPLAAAGLHLHRVEWRPAGQVVAGAVLVHGHGDCAERHAVTVAPLVERGIACTAVDFPGHGRSPGRRGVMPPFAGVIEILAGAAAALADSTGRPVTGWVGHSAGALLLLHFLAAGRETPRFVWLSSPLVEPATVRSRAVVALGRLAARLTPNLTISTGVRPADCRRAGDAGAAANPTHPTQDQLMRGLGHDRISLGWGLALLDLARRLPEAAARFSPQARLLLTQGLADRICPPGPARRLFDLLPATSKQWAGIDGALHEPFADQAAPALHAAVASWLEP